MSDLMNEILEEVREERLVNFLKKNGKFLIYCAVLLVVSTAGTVSYKYYQRSMQEKWGGKFNRAEILFEKEENQKALEILKEISEKGTEGYKNLAALKYASSLEGEEKIAEYKKISNNKKYDKAIRDNAALKAVYHEAEIKGCADINKNFNDKKLEQNIFKYSLYEIYGTCFITAGEIEKGKDILSRISGPDVPSGIMSSKETLLKTIEDKK